MVDEYRKAATVDLRYTVRLLVKHPTIDPAEITTALGIAPSLARAVGTEIVTPTGVKLASRSKQSVWNWSESIKGKRDFFDSVAELADHLEAHRQFLGTLVSSGGEIIAIVHLPGNVNIGSILKSVDLRRLAHLEISLGIEVFPEFDID
ncbi:DUF4279 domain-containing protein [Bradyrhizobium sp. Pear76]|uniref:DUF4279 domain-containing protein n=1 Tax=Bradyrhizobium oropedii TaxID=1571201 RepID=UPI001E45B762|nr:DUF4279 domain-containing protein [Bradyrhizobium oropedii]MCC8968401.1 DUF4279 domain-containing protein [Bradyrhizobium oropedii]